MAILDTLMQQLTTGPQLDQLSQQIGADRDSTATAVSGALPMLLGALDRNANQAGGASGLAAALDRDHDGSVLDDVAGFLGGGSSSAGQGILGHLFGGRTNAAETSIAKMAGLDQSTVGHLLTLLAPIVLGALGKAKREQGLSEDGVAGLLRSEREAAPQEATDVMGLASRLLDSDGDGDVGDDLSRIGKGVLGRFLGGR